MVSNHLNTLSISGSFLRDSWNDTHTLSIKTGEFGNSQRSSNWLAKGRGSIAIYGSSWMALSAMFKPSNEILGAASYWSLKKIWSIIWPGTSISSIQLSKFETCALLAKTAYSVVAIFFRINRPSVGASQVKERSTSPKARDDGFILRWMLILGSARSADRQCREKKACITRNSQYILSVPVGRDDVSASISSMFIFVFFAISTNC